MHMSPRLVSSKTDIARSPTNSQSQLAALMLRSLARRTCSALRRAPQLLAPRLTGRGYHDIVIDHYESPRNVGSLDKKVRSRNIVVELSGKQAFLVGTASRQCLRSISSDDHRMSLRSARMRTLVRDWWGRRHAEM